MGYEGGDLPLPGRQSGCCPGLCAQAVGGGLAWVVGRLPLVTWQRIRGGWCHKMRYTNRRLITFFLTFYSWPNCWL